MRSTFFDPSDLRRRLLQGWSWATLGHVVLLGSGVVMTAILARLLPPGGVGGFYLALNVVVVAAMVSSVGIDQAVLQQVSQLTRSGRPGLAAAYVRTGAFAVLTTSAVLAMIFATGAGRRLTEALFGSTLLAAAAAPVAVWIVAATVQRYLSQAYRALHRIKESILFGGRSRFGGILATTLTVAVLSALLVAHGQPSLRVALWITAACAAAASMVGGARLLSEASHHAGHHVEDRREARLGGLLRIGFPLSLHSVSEYLTRRADIWVVGILLTDRATGLYGAVAALALLASTPLNVVNTFLPPIIGELHRKGDSEQIEELCGLTAGLAFVATGAVVLVFVALGGVALQLLYGSYYAAGWPLLVILAAGEVAKVGVGSSGMALMMTDHQRALMWSSMAGGALALGSGLYLGSHFGLAGIAVASAGSVTVQQVTKLVLVRRSVGIWVHARPIRALRMVMAAAAQSRA